MSEITKLYENAGLSNMWVERYNDGYNEHERYYNSYKEMINNMMKANDWTLTEAQEVAKRECRKEHPPFTAEKQIELIKFLLKNYEGVDISKKINRFNFLVDNATFVGCHHNDKSFEESLAGVINKLWADMSEEEKQQIKEILE